MEAVSREMEEQVSETNNLVDLEIRRQDSTLLIASIF